jgi:hypothetical protein
MNPEDQANLPILTLIPGIKGNKSPLLHCDRIP